ncbi:SusC/RagA family TonB-linked outer membrane protein [Reichenbachiella agariperforans]|uniref:SusC/RagA family TonB-linked outer membrane protein n=1 Tax=Reichenbachiella agariperforans TaxID=156994 RepID=UPI001C097A7B|nr:TonB-dependent receptor [Reichenbachiella agariperforans]MBU2914325.1 TonB-dependent receptor [Reichenbachiella agariperforans]
MKEDLLKRFKLVIAILVIAAASSAVQAQSNKVQGVVTSFNDESGIPGAAVLIEGTSIGTVTDFDGAFTIEASPDAVLVISFVGYKTVKVPVNNQSQIDVQLEEDYTSLEEVVVVGYGTVKKSDLSGSVSSVKSADIAAFPALSATQTLQGRAAGVQINSNNGGQPGASFNVKIRGGTSINASSDPITVVDGFVGAEMPPPEDIASIEVLKDASATAIYGSRGANGVIMVTTKKGSKGKIKIDFNSSYSTQSPTKQLDLLNAAEFTDYMNEFAPYTNLGSDTNWQDEIYQTGIISNNQLSVSGGAENVTYYLSGTYFDQQGVVVGSEYKRYSLNGNVNVEATKFLKLGMSMYGRRGTNVGVRTQEGSGGAGQAGVTSTAFRFNPDLGIYDANGMYTRSTIGDQLDNPVAMATQYDRERVTDRFQSNVYADLKFTDWLSFKTTLGIGSTNWRDGEYWPTTLIRGQGADGLGGIESRKQSSVISENYFTVDKEYGPHRLTWVTGYSFQKNTSEAWKASSQGFITDAGRFWSLDQGAVPNTPTSSLTESTIKSFYSRANYSLQNKYVLTFTGRYDGASNFAANNKWAFFPSGAVAWDIKGESFMDDLNFLTQLKLRGSYGLTGNQAIGPYQSLASLEPTYSIVPGGNALAVGTLANPDLTWETTSQVDVGLDIGLFEGRVNVVMDYYEKITSDLLFQRQLPSYVGVGTQLQNIGKVSNKGFEFMLSTKNLVGEFTWNSDFIISANRNEVLELPDSVEFYGQEPGHFLLDGSSQLLLEGQPVGVFYGYDYQGIYQTGDAFIPGSGFEQEAGGESYADISGPDGEPDGLLSGEDRKIIGNPHPDFVWSFNNSFGYKNFDLNIFIQGVHGNDMLSFTNMELETMSGKSNVLSSALDRWTPTDPNTDVPKASSTRAFRVSDKYVYDASYVRLKNVTLGYTFPKTILDKTFIRSLRLYVSGQNLLTMTDYPGLDPEVGYQNSGSGADGNRNIGLDYASYPNVRAYTFGINLGL